MTINDIRNGGWTVMNTISLVTDVASVVIPIVPAGVSHALRAAKLANKAVNAVDTAADTVKLVKKTDDVLDAAKKPIIIIGENMDRVTEFAKRVKGQTIQDFIPGSEWNLSKNTAWIKQMREEGRTIWDIGPDFYRRLDRIDQGIKPVRSKAYEIERMVLKNYDKYRKNFFRIKQLGGIPGMDF